MVGVPQGGHSGGDISAVLGVGATPGGSTRSCGRELSRDVPGMARVGRQGGRGGAGVVGRGVGGGGRRGWGGGVVGVWVHFSGLWPIWEWVFIWRRDRTLSEKCVFWAISLYLSKIWGEAL